MPGEASFDVRSDREAALREGRPEAVLYRIVHEQPDLAGVDARLVPVLTAALSRNPATRPSPESLLASLRTAAGTHPPDPTAVGTAVMTRTQLLVPDKAPDITGSQPVASSSKRGG